MSELIAELNCSRTFATVSHIDVANVTRTEKPSLFDGIFQLNGSFGSIKVTCIVSSGWMVTDNIKIIWESVYARFG